MVSYHFKSGPLTAKTYLKSTCTDALPLLFTHFIIVNSLKMQLKVTAKGLGYHFLDLFLDAGENSHCKRKLNICKFPGTHILHITAYSPFNNLNVPIEPPKFIKFVKKLSSPVLLFCPRNS